MLTKNDKSTWFSRLPLALVLIGLSSILLGCDDRPTASLKVVATFDDCTTEYTTELHSNGEPVTTPALLSGVNDETESDLGCDIGELEYAFNNNPLAAKIEFDVDETGEVTAFVPLDNKTRSPQPFIIDTPNFKSVSVEVSFPNANTAPLRGSIQAKER